MEQPFKFFVVLVLFLKNTKPLCYFYNLLDYLINIYIFFKYNSTVKTCSFVQCTLKNKRIFKNWFSMHNVILLKNGGGGGGYNLLFKPLPEVPLYHITFDVI